MSVDSKVLSLPEAATLLGKTERETLKLCQCGYLVQSNIQNGKMQICLSSLERYSKRSGISLVLSSKRIRRYGTYTMSEAMKKLSFSEESQIHRLIQAGLLKAYFQENRYVIDAQSIHDYGIGGY